MITIGIFRGLSGAVAILAEGLSLLEMYDMPALAEVKRGKTRRHIDAEGLVTLLRPYAGIGHAEAECVASRPDGGVAGSFNFRCGAGLVQGVMAGLETSLTLLIPVDGTRRIHIPADRGKDCWRSVVDGP